MKRLLLILALAACGRQHAVTSMAAANESVRPLPRAVDVDACSLLTPQELALFGALKGTPRPGRGLQNERECRYANLDGQWLETSVYRSDRWELEKGIVSEQHPQPVANLGDEAFSVKPSTDSVVYVRKGGAVLQVSSSAGMETTTALAAKAAAHLKEESK